MAPAPATSVQIKILAQLIEVTTKVDESLALGRDNGNEIKMLRRELGLEGTHGRLPQLEQAVARLDRQQETDHKDLEKRVDALEKEEHEATGKQKLASTVWAIIGGSAGAAVIALLAHMLGVH